MTTGLPWCSTVTLGRPGVICTVLAAVSPHAWAAKSVNTKAAYPSLLTLRMDSLLKAQPDGGIPRPMAIN
jgi:hypothetical protein